MRACIYTTDPGWLNALRGQPYESVNFWRGDQRDFGLERGSTFYFKLNEPGSLLIAGKGGFIEARKMSIPAAWQEFGTANGVSSEDDLRQKVKEVLRIEPDADICCLILKRVKILPVVQYIPITDKEYSPGPKPYRLLHDSQMAEVREMIRQRINP